MQRRTVNFRYGTPRKAGSDRRDKKPGPQVAAPENHSSCLSLSLSLFLVSLFFRALGLHDRAEESAGKS